MTDVLDILFQTLMNIQKQINSLVVVVLQNRSALDMLTDA
jgi:hypothetical protein